MQILLFLLIFIILFGSLITSFTAIIQILRNDFKESKTQWILISMAAIIGPILWLTKGRKLIIKKDSKQVVENIDKSSVKEHYSELIKNSETPLRILIFSSVFLILFGYLVRLFDIYFFWESTYIGFGLLLIAIAKFLLDDTNARRQKKLNRSFAYIGFGFFCFIILIVGLMAILIPNSNAYKAAKENLRNDSNLILKIGKIHSFSVIPIGSMGTQSNEYGTTGDANLTLIIKGEKKYVEKNIILRKELEEDWKIITVD